MRMRKRAHLSERIDGCGDYIIETADELYGFSGDKSLCIEIGCGKGRFITETARLNPAAPTLPWSSAKMSPFSRLRARKKPG